MEKQVKVFLISLLCINIFVGSAYAQTEQELYLQAKDLLDNYHGNRKLLKAANKIIFSMHEQYPNSALAYVALGRLIRMEGYISYRKYVPGSLEKAQKYFNEAIHIDPQCFDAYYSSFYNSIGQNDLSTAKEFLRKAEKKDPKSEKVDDMYMAVAMEEKHYEETVNRANAILMKTEQEALIHNAYFTLQKMYRKQNKYNLAKEAYLKEIAIFPNNAWLMDSYGAFLIYTMKDYDKGIEYCRKALEIMEFGMAKKHLSYAYYKKGADLLWVRKLYEIAADNFTTSIKYEPTANAYYGLGIAHWYIGSSTQRARYFYTAEKALQDALNLKPDHKEAKKQLVKLQIMMKKGRRQ